MPGSPVIDGSTDDYEDRTRVERQQRILDVIALCGVGITVVIGLCAVLAGAGGPNVIGSLIVRDAPVSPATGVGLVAAGCGLLTWRAQRGRSRRAPLAALAAAIVLLGLGVATVMHVALSGSPALRDVLMWGHGSSVTPSLTMGIALVVSGIALLTLVSRRRFGVVCAILAAVVFWIGLLGVTGHIFEASIFRAVRHGLRLSLSASVACMSLGMAFALIDRDGIVARRFQRMDSGGRLLRLGFPLVLIGSLGIAILTRGLIHDGALSVDSADQLGVNAMTFLVLAACWSLAGEMGRADDRLRTAESTLRTVTETVQDAFWVTSADATELSYVSRGYERIWGRPMSELRQDPASWLEGVHPDDRARVVRAFATVADPGGFSEEWRVLHPDGEIRWVAGRAWMLRDRDGHPLRLVGVGQDITELRHAQLEREQSELRFHEVAERLDEVLLITTPTAEQVLYANPAYEQIWGRTVEELYEHPDAWLQSIHPEDRGRVQSALRTGSVDETFRVLRPDGSLRWVRDRSFAIRDARGTPHRLAGLASDITDQVQSTQALERSRERYRHQALHDALTGLANRALFLDRVAHALAPREDGQLATVMLIDLDHFKAVNDTFGHAVGDELLEEVARRLRSCLRAEDTAARLGGDEFAVLVARPRSDIAALLGQRIATKLADPYACASSAPMQVTASVGLAVRVLRDHDADALIHRADLAMYEAKAHGGAQLVLALA
jgi:diguanylate cyclase (GGDEF)-like protein/PAS domain S-box-containing protein